MKFFLATTSWSNFVWSTLSILIKTNLILFWGTIGSIILIQLANCSYFKKNSKTVKFMLQTAKNKRSIRVRQRHLQVCKVNIHLIQHLFVLFFCLTLNILLLFHCEKPLQTMKCVSELSELILFVVVLLWTLKSDTEALSWSLTRKRRNCWIKLPFLFSLCTKSILVAS